MREILVKNLSSSDKSRRLFSLSEKASQAGISFTTKRKCFYVIKKCKHFINRSDLEEWAKSNLAAKNLKHPSVSIRRNASTAKRKQRFDCKVRGGFYAAWKMDVFYINYIISMSIGMKPQMAL